MKVSEVSLTLAEHDLDIKIYQNKSLYTEIPQSCVTRLCAFNLLRYQVKPLKSSSPEPNAYDLETCMQH